MRTWREMRGFPLAVQLLLVNQLGVNTCLLYTSDAADE